ncbi:MAG: hypothetical protein WDN72_07180 [Alphaproteobacteria bacterium]
MPHGPGPRTTKIAPGPDARKLNSLEGEDLKPLRLFQQRLYDRYGLELQFTEETGELVQGVPEQHFEPVPIPNAAPGAQILPTGIRITAYQPVTAKKRRSSRKRRLPLRRESSGAWAIVPSRGRSRRRALSITRPWIFRENSSIRVSCWQGMPSA